MKKLLSEYINGNYTVRLYDDGTKEKFTENDFFKAEFPDSIDIKITNFCDANCPMCHENSNTMGKHAKLNASFLKTLRSGTELAIGGGNPLSHPDLVPFLREMKNAGIICNITVNEKHLTLYNELIDRLIKEQLVWGIGVSITNAEEKTVEFLREYKNSVAHIICGIITPNILKKLKDVKVLVLGYKQKGRGEKYFSEKIECNIKGFRSILPALFNYFESMSFDNLAIEQTQIEKLVAKEEYEKHFMGKDGEASMYIDLVSCRYAISSLSNETFPLKNDLLSMFKHINGLI